MDRLLQHLLDGVRTEEFIKRNLVGKKSACTLVDQLFGGQLLITITCDVCHKPHRTLEPFMDLSLPLLPKGQSVGVVDQEPNNSTDLHHLLQSSNHHRCSVPSCLDLFTASEMLTVADKYNCKHCPRMKNAVDSTALSDDGASSNALCAASKNLLIFVPPFILTLHLKRFLQDGDTLVKSKEHVDFPFVLDLAPYCSGAAVGLGSVPAGESHVLYSLYGVLEHNGELDQDCYTAYVKVRADDHEAVAKLLKRLPMETDDIYRLLDNHKSSRRPFGETDDDNFSSAHQWEGVWYRCSGSQVTSVGADEVLQSQALLLFYERKM